MYWASALRLYSILLLLANTTWSKKPAKSLVESVEDHKEFKKLLRTKTNVLVLFSASEKKSAEAVKAVLWIRNYFFRIRIPFSVEFWIRIRILLD
jgi:hypothetical protein